MELIPVESSNIAAIGYESGTLHVRFKDGATYQYADVTEDQHVALMAAPSKGRWLKEFRLGEKVPTVKDSLTTQSPDKFHTTQAEGCCKLHLNNASVSGQLDRAESFVCPKCGTAYTPNWHGPLALWEPDFAFAVVR